MRRFARLYTEIDSTTRTNEKVEAMARYLASATHSDAAWAVYFLSGGRPKRLVPVRRLVAWAMEESGTPDWLFEESYNAVGDLAETIALLLPETSESSDASLTHWVEERLLPLARLNESAQRDVILDAWRALSGLERYVWNKLITGSFRVGVSQALLVRAVSRASGVPEEIVSHRVAGDWRPTADGYARLIAQGDDQPHL